MMKRNKTKSGKSKESQAGLSSLAEARLRRKLRRTVPSEPWVDAQFTTRLPPDSDGTCVIRVHNPHVFPPGGAQTAMKRCPRCGVMTPPFAFEGGICLDHRERGNWGPSPSAQAIAALERMNVRLAESPLPSESTRDLLAEIKRAQNKKRGRRLGSARKETTAA
jgi:hypothetical protein